jgi:hypothetical protein
MLQKERKKIYIYTVLKDVRSRGIHLTPTHLLDKETDTVDAACPSHWKDPRRGRPVSNAPASRPESRLARPPASESRSLCVCHRTARSRSVNAASSCKGNTSRPSRACFDSSQTTRRACDGKEEKKKKRMPDELWQRWLFTELAATL